MAKNVLQLNELAQASALAQVYVVYNAQDFRMSLQTLLSLVSATSLGLDKVNNTSDLEKPVSQAMTIALSDKADKSDVVSKATFEALVQSMGTYISLETLNTAIKGITDQLNGYATTDYVAEAVNDALLTVAGTIDALTKNVQSNTAAITSLQESMKTTVVEKTLTDAIAASKNEIVALMGQQTQSFNETIGQLSTRIDALDQSMGQLQTAMSDKADKVHSHSATDISDLEAIVKDLVGTATGEVTIGSTEW